MLDLHIHTRVSFDSREDPRAVVAAAERCGLKEICFTDHLDYDPLGLQPNLTFDTGEYADAYDGLKSDRLVICRGMEFGMLPDNRAQLEKDLQRRPFDYVIGSVHFAAGLDVWLAPYWQDKSPEQAQRQYLEEVLACVEAHDDFDVLGHLTYISKAAANPLRKPIPMSDYQNITDEIFRILIRKEKGIEVNTSGMPACGAFLPDEAYLYRFRELGGRLVTVGSDAHNSQRVGQHCEAACRLVQSVFGYVCSFHQRRPIFHNFSDEK